MEKHADKNETPALISLSVKSGLNDSTRPDETKIVLPDECGDTLWDDVLNQEQKACSIKRRTE